MRVKIEFIVETEDFGFAEFKKEIQNLILDIDPNTKLLTFGMEKII